MKTTVYSRLPLFCAIQVAYEKRLRLLCQPFYVHARGTVYVQLHISGNI